MALKELYDYISSLTNVHKLDNVFLHRGFLLIQSMFFQLRFTSHEGALRQDVICYFSSKRVSVLLPGHTIVSINMFM